MLAEVHSAAPMIVFAVLTGAASVISSFIIVDKDEGKSKRTKLVKGDEEGKEKLMMSNDE
jgi:hypothetical protein